MISAGAGGWKDVVEYVRVQLGSRVNQPRSAEFLIKVCDYSVLTTRRAGVEVYVYVRLTSRGLYALPFSCLVRGQLRRTSSDLSSKLATQTARCVQPWTTPEGDPLFYMSVWGLHREASDLSYCSVWLSAEKGDGSFNTRVESKTMQ